MVEPLMLSRNSGVIRRIASGFCRDIELKLGCVIGCGCGSGEMGEESRSELVGDFGSVVKKFERGLSAPTVGTGGSVIDLRDRGAFCFGYATVYDTGFFVYVSRRLSPVLGDGVTLTGARGGTTVGEGSLGGAALGPALEYNPIPSKSTMPAVTTGRPAHKNFLIDCLLTGTRL
jgi:hypothetical protein